MATIELTRRGQDKTPPSGFRKVTRWLGRRMPTGLYARSLLIIIIPMVLLQSVLAFVFMERHWQMVTERLSTAVVHDIAGIIDVMQTYPQDASNDQIIRIARDRLELNIAIEPPAPLPPPRPKPFFSILDQALSKELSEQINLPFWLDTVGNSNLIEIRVQLPSKKILRVFAKRSQAYASNTHIFLMWMVGASLVLLGIAILFLRGQIRPILALARAAENFGKGQPTPEDFRPRGADEVRRAGVAFIRMRERIEKSIEQRTAMLSGVSHDLRTVLTRFKLQLAIVGDAPEFEGLSEDVEEMQSMLEGYLSFARSEAEEDVGMLDLEKLFGRIETDAKIRERALSARIDGDPIIKVRPKAFSRLITNLTANALRYADTVEVRAIHDSEWVTIMVDDDGPGIPPEAREEVFKPFFRLDQARNLDESGTGLGLSIARDIARSHGGEVTLSDSPMGGLRATIRIPS